MDDFVDDGSSEFAKKTYNDINIDRNNEFLLGPISTYGLINDPKRIGFSFARYKFVAKMFHGLNRVLEIGCQEGLGALIVAKEVNEVVGIDFYKPHIDSCNKRLGNLPINNIKFFAKDILANPIKESFDGVFALDVIEHIDPIQEDLFMKNIVGSLSNKGLFILGTPSLESQAYASSVSKEGHINCKSGEQWRSCCQKYFEHVFMFGMNDEVLHTGYLPMAHYIFTFCVDPLPGV